VREKAKGSRDRRRTEAQRGPESAQEPSFSYDPHHSHPRIIERRYVAGRPPHFAGYRVYELVADLACVVIPKSKPLVAFTGDESHVVRLRGITTASSPAASLSSCRPFARRPASAGPGMPGRASPMRSVPVPSGTDLARRQNLKMPQLATLDP
jgi:hypothetical protein